jgi:hypothetical protein
MTCDNVGTARIQANMSAALGQFVERGMELSRRWLDECTEMSRLRLDGPEAFRTIGACKKPIQNVSLWKGGLLWRLVAAMIGIGGTTDGDLRSQMLVRAAAFGPEAGRGRR